jgi:hypothetical protein
MLFNDPGAKLSDGLPAMVTRARLHRVLELPMAAPRGHLDLAIVPDQLDSIAHLHSRWVPGAAARCFLAVLTAAPGARRSIGTFRTFNQDAARATLELRDRVLVLRPFGSANKQSVPMAWLLLPVGCRAVGA